jgi:hypothetical protein
MNIATWRDGLDRVDCGSFCAGFVISNGHLVAIAPALRKNFDLLAHAAFGSARKSGPKGCSQIPLAKLDVPRAFLQSKSMGAGC